MIAVLELPRLIEVLAMVGVPDPPASIPTEDQARIARALGGDRRAFDEIYRRHADEVYRRLSRLVGPDPEREDLVQQVFIAVFRGLPSFRGDSAFSTWLYRIIVHIAYHHLRRRKQRAYDVSLLELELPDEGASPEALARQRQDLGRALGMLSRLDPRKRIAFVLRTVEGLSLDEIGEIVGAKAPAVGQRVKHAQRELSQMIAREDLIRQRQEGRA